MLEVPAAEHALALEAGSLDHPLGRLVADDDETVEAEDRGARPQMSHRMSRTRHFASIRRRYSALTVDETPLIRDTAVEVDAARLAELRAGDVLWQEDDTLAGQLRALVGVRSRAVDMTADELDARVQLEGPASRPGS